MKLIKLLFTIFIVSSYCNFAKSDDIKDFQIEGMSIGDSLLNFYSQNQIIENIDPNVLKNTDGKFKTTGFYGSFNEFDGMQFTFKPSDKKYIIYSISAGIFYSNIQQCDKKLKSISKELSSLFSNSEIFLDIKQSHPSDKTGKSTATSDIFMLKTGSASVRCTDWSDEITTSYGWSDNLRVGVKSKEYNDWLPE